MMEEKNIIAKNLIMYRKAAKLTQQELADKLSYTDKAVSKWERAEALPDILVLKQLADMYGITVDELLKEHEQPVEPKTPEIKKRRMAKHLLIALLSAGLVWFAATIIVVVTLLIDDSLPVVKFAYISAIPASLIVLLVFNVIWGKMPLTAVIVSALVWSLCLLLHMILTPIPKSWLIYLIGAVLQILVILWFLLQYVRKKYRK